MREAPVFYVTQSDHRILLHLISEEQWNAGIELTQAERSAFAWSQFKGKLGDSCLLPDDSGQLKKVYIGSGSGAGHQELALAHAALTLPVGCYQVQEKLTQGGALSWGLAQYRFLTYKKLASKKQENQCKLLIVEEKELEAILASIQAHYLVRDMVNTPTNDMGPKEMALLVEQLAKQYKAQFKQWVGKELLVENFPAIYAVGRAADSAPRLLSLTWGEEKHPLITLVGKGVCFDSGGLNIKPTSNMRWMKKDMAGAAHVIALALWIMMRNLPVRLQLLVPAVENAIGPDALRPGDVITMRNGLTVEVDNTDAEGRLVLADALVKACEAQPELLIDFATLTGAARVAVGTEIAAMFCNQDSLAKQVIQASHQASDPLWRLPLFEAYEHLLHSTIADLVNAHSSPYAGAIVAGLFLQRFVSQPIPWIHFDIMAWNTSSKPGRPEGGEAMGLRAVMEYLLQKYGGKV